MEMWTVQMLHFAFLLRAETVQLKTEEKGQDGLLKYLNYLDQSS